LPSAHKASQRKGNALTARPGRVKLFTVFKINTHIVNLDDSAGCHFGPRSHLDIPDSKFGGSVSLWRVNLWL
jgi:hypothetical protein